MPACLGVCCNGQIAGVLQLLGFSGLSRAWPLHSAELCASKIPTPWGPPDPIRLLAKVALHTLLALCRHYHPDRNHTDPDDTWFVLCEEMTKMLTVQYDKLSM